MKKQILILAAVITLTMGAAHAQTAAARADNYKKANIVMAEKNYLACLKSGNDGAIESGLGMIVRMKLNLPDRKFEALGHEIYDLMVKGPTARIRYQAYLTYTVMNNPELFAAEARIAYQDTDSLFAALATRLQQTYLSAAFTR